MFYELMVNIRFFLEGRGCAGGGSAMYEVSVASFNPRGFALGFTVRGAQFQLPSIPHIPKL